jgi:methylenetetrahydrofolate dehydrogenase (NADP+)/methenyltetrahydrofolate cyclohydrolase
MKILDGIKVRDFIAEKIKKELKKLKVKPKLVIIQIGNDERSAVYVRQKKIFGEKLGFEVEYIQLDKNIEQKDIISKIEILNNDKFVNGIIVQLPIPRKLNQSEIMEKINPLKDVDGMNYKNLGSILGGDMTHIIPATTRGILSLLDFYKIKIEGKKVLILGRSLLVGRPTALAFLNRDATVTICHSKTKNIKDEIKRADIIISAIGIPNFIKKTFVRKGQIVIDVGISKIGDKIVGDADFKQISKIVSFITPVPGGIGPMTVVSLFENLLLVYKKQIDMVKYNS